MTAAAEPPGAREALVALLAALVLAALPVRAGLFDGDRVLLGVDSATALLPWRAVVSEEERAVAPRNGAQYDQAVVFYPTYRWVARSWLAGDPPLWNPLIYAGAPGVGNPQAGVLDPQVLALVALEALGGRALFDRGFALLAWLRLAAAGLGAYLLARRLGLGRRGGVLAGVGYGLSGYLLLWLGHPLGHVPPFLPWILLGLEGTRGARPRLAAAGAGLALLGMILAGHPETAFFGGAAAGLWALAIARRDRRAGRLALGGLALGVAAGAASLLPFVEYLMRSGAREIRALQAARAGLDLAALGALILGGALAISWRAACGAPRPPGRSRRLGLVASTAGLAGAAGGIALLLRSRGLADEALCALLPDAFGAPGDGGAGYQGTGSLFEVASGFAPAVVLALAFAAMLAPAGHMRRRSLAAGLGLGAWLLCLGVPGLIDLWRRVPLVGLGDTARLGATSSLFLALLAGEALEAAPRAARAAGALVVGALALALAAAPATLAPEAMPQPQEDEHVGFLSRPPPAVVAGESRVEGWIGPGLPVERAELAVSRLGPDGTVGEEVIALPAVFAGGPSDAARSAAPEAFARAPTGARWFSVPYVAMGSLDRGAYVFALRLYAAGASTPLGERVAGATVVERAPAPRAATVALFAAGLGAVALAPVGGAASWLLVALALAHALFFARGLNPAVPRAACFPATRTEAALAGVLGDGRYFSGPQVMPPDTGLVSGLRGLDGYDGMDPLSYNRYRGYCLAGGNALLGWHARGVELGAPAFRLLGANALVTRAPLEAAGFELLTAPPDAECWIYRATDPFPRAFLVPGVVAESELAKMDLASWDPRAVAAVDGGWRPTSPFTEGAVESIAFEGNNRVRVRARLDGEGLLVVTEQHFPGWRAEVDGEAVEILRANGLFRAVPLAAGEHEVVLRYAPGSLRLGIWVSALALLGLVGLALSGRRGPQGSPASPSA